MENFITELNKLKEEMDHRDEKIRSKLSFLLSRIQELEKSLDVVKGDLFERQEDINKNQKDT